MRNIKLTLQYDGTDYRGWQSQRKGERTVQCTLQDAVHRLTGRHARLTAAGRTDSGVHALGQVASFRTSSELDTATIKRALNALLPPDIRVTAAAQADDAFHPQYQAVSKRYFYLIANMEYASPFLERYVWRIPQRLDVTAMRRAGKDLLGRHDFSAFRASGSSARSTEREVKSLTVAETDRIGFLGAAFRGRFLRITVVGSGFLRHMVRNIVGTLVECGRGKVSPESVLVMLASRNRRTAGPTAPARGLFLEKVSYR